MQKPGFPEQMERYRQGTLQAVGNEILQEAEAVQGKVEKLPRSSAEKVKSVELRGEWSSEDDRQLLEMVLEMGNKWSNIAKVLKSRT